MNPKKLIYFSTILFFGWLGYQIWFAPAGPDYDSVTCSTHRSQVATVMQWSQIDDGPVTISAAREVSDHPSCFDQADIIWADSYLQTHE